MPDSTFEFYQQLAKDYHLIYADWTKAIERQGATLDRLIRAQIGGPPLTVLDCSCGIGTQAIALARRGYTVHATDLSPAAVERAAREAAAQGAALTVGVADFRTLETQVAGTFDIVLSCDNSLPHLLTDDDLRQAARSMRAKLRSGGLLLISIRDYDHLTLEKPRATLPQVYDDGGGRRIVFQVWDWDEDGRTYTFSMFILRASAQGWIAAHYATSYRALLRAELSAALGEAGLVDLRWHMPQDSGYYQPIVTARG
jgi:SAM-dependent methyltransferase